MRLSLLATAVVLSGGCNTMAVRDCLIECTAASGCPDGFSCGAENVCRANGATGTCGEVLGDAGIKRRIAVITTGNGEGTVSSTPAGIDCGTECVHEFAAGSPVSLIATAASGSMFAGWSGDCSGTGDCNLGSLDDADVAATFELCSTTAGSQTFDFTGAPQTLALPACATSLTIDARGGAGGRAMFEGAAVGTGGLGGRTRATIAVAPGDTFTVFVGGAGDDEVAGYNGGGLGATWLTQRGGGGGGASDIRRNGTTLADRVVVAGGGSGAAACQGVGWPGAAGGGQVGGTVASRCNITLPKLASGGTQSAGGIGGSYGGDSNAPACAAASGSLGDGADACNKSAGGGGGGGYYGGGGGTWTGGGGGSSFVIAGATSVNHTQGSQTGDGQVIVSWQ